MTTPNHDSDPICGNCGKPRSEHFHEHGEVFCNQHTNGDVFTDEPSDATLVAWMRAAEIVRQDWKRHHGHGG